MLPRLLMRAFASAKSRTPRRPRFPQRRGPRSRRRCRFELDFRRRSSSTGILGESYEEAEGKSREEGEGVKAFARAEEAGGGAGRWRGGRMGRERFVAWSPAEAPPLRLRLALTEEKAFIARFGVEQERPVQRVSSSSSADVRTGPRWRCGREPAVGGEGRVGGGRTSKGYPLAERAGRRPVRILVLVKVHLPFPSRYELGVLLRATFRRCPSPAGTDPSTDGCSYRGGMQPSVDDERCVGKVMTAGSKRRRGRAV